MSITEDNPKKKSGLGLLIKRLIFIALPILIIVGAIVGNIVLSAIAPKPEEKEDTIEALPVLTAAAELEPLRLIVRTQGEVRPRSEVTLASQLSGRVTYVSPGFLEGGQFSRGETLVRLDDEEFALRVVQAEATVAQAETALTREMSEADAARIEAEQLGIEDVSALTLREPQLAEARARLASAKAARDEAKLHLSRTKIIAPFDGRVRTRAVNVGAFISPGSRLGDIYATDIVDIPVPLTDKDLAALDLPIGFIADEANSGPEVTLSAAIADRQHSWIGKITRTDSGFDPETRVLFAYIEVEDPYGVGADNGTPLATGLFVDAEIEGRAFTDSITVPRTALRGKETVYIATPDKTLEIRLVNVASSNREHAVIASGLEVGELVVTSPVKGAADGMIINPVDRLQVASNGVSEPAGSDVSASSQN